MAKSTIETIEERFNLLKTGKELSLAIEGKFTNLRIWTRNGETVFMRLDKAKNYSTPLTEETFNYLEKKETPVKDLVQFGFKSSINNLDEILEITKEMKQRNCIAW